MSKTHQVVKGDTLGKISIKYLGTFAKWTRIKAANPQLTGRGKAIDGSPLIYPGDILTIPDEEKKVALKIDSKSDDELAIVVNDKRFNYFTSYDLVQEMDAFDSFSFSAPFIDTNDDYINSFKPFAYKECQVYYGGDLFFNGVLLAPQTESTATGKSLNLTGYPKCGVLNDCPLPISMFPCEFNNQDIKKIAEKMIDPFSLELEITEDAGNKFKKVAPEMTEIILSFLIKLAEQRDFIITNNVEGKLLIWKTKKGNTVASIEEGDTQYLKCSPTFNPQEFYSHVTGVSSTNEKKKSAKYTYENSYLKKLGVFRPYTYLVQDVKDTEIKKAVLAKAGRMFANAASYELTVRGHRDKDKKIWRKNTLIMLKAPGAMIFKNTKFMIKRVTIRKSVTEGYITVMNLVLPESYSGENIESYPWEK